MLDCFLDIGIAVTSDHLFFYITYKKGINYAPIINRINSLSEKVLSPEKW